MKLIDWRECQRWWCSADDDYDVEDKLHYTTLYTQRLNGLVGGETFVCIESTYCARDNAHLVQYSPCTLQARCIHTYMLNVMWWYTLPTYSKILPYVGHCSSFPLSSPSCCAVLEDCAFCVAAQRMWKRQIFLYLLNQNVKKSNYIISSYITKRIRMKYHCL